MNLEIQIQSLIFSLVFGMFFALMYNLFYKYLFKGKVVIRAIVNILFVSFNTMLYFFLMQIINNGIIHSYFLLMVVVGFTISNIKTRRIRKYRLEYFN